MEMNKGNQMNSDNPYYVMYKTLSKLLYYQVTLSDPIIIYYLSLKMKTVLKFVFTVNVSEYEM